MPGKIDLYAGSLGDVAQFKPRMTILTRSRAPWDTVAKGLREYETVPE